MREVESQPSNPIIPDKSAFRRRCTAEPGSWVWPVGSWCEGVSWGTVVGLLGVHYWHAHHQCEEALWSLQVILLQRCINVLGFDLENLVTNYTFGSTHLFCNHCIRKPWKMERCSSQSIMHDWEYTFCARLSDLLTKSPALRKSYFIETFHACNDQPMLNSTVKSKTWDDTIMHGKRVVVYSVQQSVYNKVCRCRSYWG